MGEKHNVLQKGSNYKDLPDEALVALVREGNREALDFLIRKYRIIVRIKARSYFLIGADNEDIVQEGMIGLYKAVRDFDADKENSFKGFAELCITRQIITAIKTATRQKHTPLNSSISLDKPMYEDEAAERTLMDMIINANIEDPEKILIQKEEIAYLDVKAGEVLSDLEQQVLARYLDGQTYAEISVELQRHVKSIDNALQRVKRKLEQYLEVEELL